MTHLLVVGAGLGGAMAALTAARRNPDADVTVLSTETDRFCREVGTIDLLGYLPDESTPVERPLSRLSELPESHPYRLLGTDTVRDGLALFDDLTGDAYHGGGDTANALLATCTGELRPASRYPAGMARGLASDRRDVLLVGIKQVTALDAYYLGDRLGETLPYSVGGVPVTFPLDTINDSPVTGIAAAFDDRTEVEDKPVLDAFLEEVRSVLDIEPRVGFPAVLGRTSHGDVRETLGDRLNVEVFEVAIGPPSLPGLRLGDHLRAALDDAGVTVETGEPVDYESEGGHVTRLYADTAEGHTTYEAERFVLATGGLDGPGLSGDRDGVHEPVFGCHVPQPADRTKWTDPDPLADQPFARFGVRVDTELRPLDGHGRAEFGNLHAVGSVLGGHNVAREKSRSGVAVTTGYAAGLLV
ncbi:MAG: glycerol-3-phosphate dehydrogenase subunit GlpB [Halovenus sp.]